MTENPENPENPEITHETERRARLTWSLLAEPSDAVALMARERLGSRAALELAREATPTELLAALDGQVPAEAADPGTGTPDASASRALQRWRSRLAAVDVEAVLEDAYRRRIRVLIPG
ncbi:MAG TPA: DNA-protecting protein DprA, partial [Brachybacterium paraconglomeratum]|nr:DNA-protecting protein DprA [Brachybacterium paraconglomeratum]